MLVGLKSFVISWNLGLYGLKFDKLSASVEDFSYLISYNHVDPLHHARWAAATARPRVGTGLWPVGH
jgi:hypothetical protein